MKPREYCCCAIPIINAGIYAALTEQFVAGVVIGVLAMATPDSMFNAPLMLHFPHLAQLLALRHPRLPPLFLGSYVLLRASCRY